MQQSRVLGRQRTKLTFATNMASLGLSPASPMGHLDRWPVNLSTMSNSGICGQWSNR